MENKSEIYISSIPTQNYNEIDICEEIKKSIETIILYRSLYILKKKFELKKPKIKILYNSFNLDKNSNVNQYNSYQVNIENFVIIAETIFKECNLLLTTLTNPKDIFLSNIFININQKMEEMNDILNEIKNYITDENNNLAKKYNNLFYEKKIKPNLIKNFLENKNSKIIEQMNNIELNINKNKEVNNEININEDNSNINLNDAKKEREIQYELSQNDSGVEVGEEIQKPIVEYNRKGKIIRTYNQILNDNITLSIEKEKERKEKQKMERFNNKEEKVLKYFELNNNSDYSNMQNILNNNIYINEYEENNNENNEKNHISLIDIENNKNTNNILYIDTLPLIIADYMQQFPFYCIIETESELTNELNILFDKELIEKMNNYEEALKNKNQIFMDKELLKYVVNKNKIENNIKIYENLIIQKKEKGENTSILENMLEKLIAKNIVIQEKISQMKNQKNKSKNELYPKNEFDNNINITNNIELNNISKISNLGIKLGVSNINKKINSNNKNLANEYNYSKIKISDISKPKMTTSQSSTHLKFGKNTTNKTFKIDSNTKKIMSIQEIFNFYSSQHNSVGTNGLFADIEKNMEHLTSSEFYRFCVEFNIPITRQKSNDIYKKSISSSPSAYNKSHLMNIDEFIISLKLIANNINQSKLDLLQKNIEKEKSKLNDIEKKQNKFKEMEKYNNSINFINNTNNQKNSFDKGEFYFQYEKNKLITSIFNLENKYNNEKSKNENEVINNFLIYLGINSNNDYKSNLKGFLLPFWTKEKQKSLSKTKNGIGSRLESEIKEANKIYRLKKQEKKKLVLSKEIIQKHQLFREKKKLFKLNNEKLYKDIQKKINYKYSDKLSDYKNKLEQKKQQLLENKKKEEYDKKNIISWNRLENYDVNNLEINDEEKELFNDTNNSDEEMLNKISNIKKFEKVNLNKKKLTKTNSAVELIPKSKVFLPPITQKVNLENISNNEINNSEFNDMRFNEFNMKKQETNNFGNLSAITNINQNFSNEE